MADPVFADGVTPLNAVNMNKLQTRDEKGAANGYASLDGTGKVPVAQALPTVVNGQWIKGVGGAAVWAAITQADLPAPVAGQLTALPGNDLNNIGASGAESGWYWVSAGAPNAPIAGAGYVYFNYTSNLYRLLVFYEAVGSGAGRVFMRQLYNGAWSGWTQQTSPAPYATTLPASPVDGQEVILVDSTSAPTYWWRMRYNLAVSGDKWEYVGGVPARVIYLTQESLGSSTVWQDSPTVVKFIVPRLGTYDATGQVRFTCAVANNVHLGLTVGAGGGSPPYATGSVAANNWTTITNYQRLAVAAGSDVRLRYAQDVGSAGQVDSRSLFVTPATMP